MRQVSVMLALGWLAGACAAEEPDTIDASSAVTSSDTRSDTKAPGGCAPKCGGRSCGGDGCGGSCGTCAPGEGCDARQQCAACPGGAAACSAECIADDFEADGSEDQARPLAPGLESGHSICPAGDEDWYTFTLPVTSNVTLGLTSDTDIEVHLYAFAGIQVDEDDTRDADGQPPLITADELPPGTYHVRVLADHAGDVVAGYSITLGVNATCTPQCLGKTCGPDGCGGTCGTCPAWSACTEQGTCAGTCEPDPFEPDEPQAQARPLPEGKTSGHAICPIGDEDWYTFKLTSPSDVKLSLTSDADIEVRLVRADGLPIDQDDTTDADGTPPEIAIDSLSPATYVVRVLADHAGDIVPSYTITLETNAPCIPQCAGKQCGEDGCGGTCGSCGEGEGCDGAGHCGAPCQADPFEPDQPQTKAQDLPPGVVTGHAICPAGDEDWYTFTLKSASDVLLSLTSTGFVEVHLYSADLQQIDEDDTTDSDGTPPAIVASALTPGKYYVRVLADHAGETVPEYTLTRGP